MTTFATSQRGGEPGGIAGDAVIRRSEPPRHNRGASASSSACWASSSVSLMASARHSPSGHDRAVAAGKPGVTPFAAPLPGDARSVLRAIGSATLPRLALIVLALLLIPVILPAVLGADGTQAVATV